MRLVVVTGLSGSGKTAALKALEDIGFFCVDNLPVALLPKFVQLSVLSGEVLSKVGIGMDSRERCFAAGYMEAFAEVESLGIDIEVLYLEAEQSVLLRRFSETRRRHPIDAEGGTVADSIRAEQAMMLPLKNRAELIIDTSSMNVHDLKRTLWSYFSQLIEGQELQVNLISFGFRNGIPKEADIVLDVRFLPNPYFVAELKQSLGTEKAVQDYVLESPDGKELMEKFSGLLEYLIPQYKKEGKRYLTIALGCTGGKHRSVAVVEALNQRLDKVSNQINVLHRDTEK